jgi:hypothetical protein
MASLNGMATPDTIDQGFAVVMRLVKRRDQLDMQIAAAVARMRTDGTSWERVAAALGVSKQAAWERYAGRPMIGRVLGSIDGTENAGRPMIGRVLGSIDGTENAVRPMIGRVLGSIDGTKNRRHRHRAEEP